MQCNVFFDLKIFLNINLMQNVGINLQVITIYYFYNETWFNNNKQLLLAEMAGVPLLGIYNFKLLFIVCGVMVTRLFWE